MKKGILKRILAVFLALSLTFLSIDSGKLSTLAVEEPTPADTEVTQVQPGGTGYLDIGHSAGRVESYTSVTDGLPLKQNSVLPAAYSSVELGYVTSIKNQDKWGTCWAFAACAAMESYALKHGYVDNPENVDFSEYALVYLTYQDDLYSDVTGDYTTAEVSMDKLFAAGGNDEYAFKTLSKWAGIYNEGNDTYYEDSLSGNFSEYLADESNIDFVFTGQQYINMNDRDQVKATVMENGAVAVSYYSNAKYYVGNGIYNYNYELSEYNHGVTLVGWNDEISKELFTITDSEGIEHTPENDGAWLIKNSWGTWDGYDGYIWISYEDMGILSGNAIVYQVAPKSLFDHIYQHDGATAFIAPYPTWKTASVFQVTDTKQVLEAVSFALFSTEANYTVSIYSITDRSNPTDGEVLATVSDSTTYEGYYTVMLDSPVELPAGALFSVVIEFEEVENIVIGANNISLIEGYDDNNNVVPFSTIHSDSTTGQSFIWGVGEEQDICFDTAGESGFSTEKFNNVCIKAFTTEAEPEPEPEPDISVGDIPEQTYDSKGVEPQVVVKDSEDVLVEGTDYTLSYTNNRAVGTATVTITFIGKYEDVAAISKDFTIVAKTLNRENVAAIPNQTYTGSAISPDITVTDGSAVLEEGEDYDVYYPVNVDNVNVGTVNLMITFKENYTGTADVSFEIVAIEDSSLSYEEISNKVYTGSEITLSEEELVIKNGDTVLIRDTDYDIIRYENNINAGDAEVHVEFKGNYEGTMTIPFVIDPRPATDCEVSDIGTFTYCGRAITPGVYVYFGDVELVKDKDYTVSYENNINAGENAKIVITFIGNYSGSTGLLFTIQPVELDKDKLQWESVVEMLFTGSALTPEVTITCEELGLSSEDGELEYILEFAEGVDHTNAGENISFTVTLIGNYYCAEELSGILTIVPVHVEELIIGSIANQDYTGQAITPDIVIKYGSIKLEKGKVYTLEYINNVEVGRAIVEITFHGNYMGDKTVYFEIVNPIPEKITSDDVSVDETTGYISKLSVGTTVGDFINSLNEKEYVKIYRNNTEVGGSELLGTGMQAHIMNGNEVTKTYTVIVTGDTNGDGKINITDMLAVKACVLNRSNITGAYEKAADVNGDGKINITDFIKTKAVTLKKDTITGVTVQ